MKPSLLDKEQAVKILKAAAYLGVSAFIDALIASSQGTEFGTLTPLINISLVVLKQLFTPTK